MLMSGMVVSIVDLIIHRFRSSTAEHPLQNGVSESSIREILGGEYIEALYPINGATSATRDCLSGDTNSDYLPADVKTMRETAAGAIAQLHERIVDANSTG